MYQVSFESTLVALAPSGAATAAIVAAASAAGTTAAVLLPLAVTRLHALHEPAVPQLLLALCDNM